MVSAGGTRSCIYPHASGPLCYGCWQSNLVLHKYFCSILLFSPVCSFISFLQLYNIHVQLLTHLFHKDFSSFIKINCSLLQKFILKKLVVEHSTIWVVPEYNYTDDVQHYCLTPQHIVFLFSSHFQIFLVILFLFCHMCLICYLCTVSFTKHLWFLFLLCPGYLYFWHHNFYVLH